MKKIRSAEAIKTNRWRGGLLISAALALSANSLFAAVTSISQLDNACAFSFAAISDTRADTDQDCGRAFGWIEQYDDFVLEVGDVYDGNVTSNNTYQGLWRNNTFRKNNTYPCFGNHCSKIDGGNQYRWGIPYFTLTNLNQTGWTFRATNSTKIKAFKSSDDQANKIYTYFDDRKIDYYVDRAIGGFNVHIISIYKQDHSVFDRRSGLFLYNRMLTLAANKTKHDIIIVQGHSERWLWLSRTETFAGNPVALSISENNFIAQNADIVLSASDHRFRRVNDYDGLNLVNGALHMDTGIAAGSSTGNGYCEFHVFDDPNNPRITMQYINSHATTRALHSGRANGGAIGILTARGETENDQYPAVKYVSGSVTQPLNWSTFTINNGTTTVPWVTNLTVAAAGTAITNAGLVVGGVSQEYHATVPAGKIFSQTPGGNTSVARGSSVALAASLGPQPQLVLNNSFETNTASWTLSGSGVARSTTTHANSGVASLRFTAANSSATQRVAIVSGKTYDISTYVYVSARTAGMVVFDTKDQYDAAGQGQFTFSAVNGGWTKYSGSFTATNTSLTVRMFSDGSFAGTAYFDQIELKPR